MTGTKLGRRPLVTAALAILVGLGTIAPAAAERVPPGGDSWQRGCRSIQDMQRDLQSELNNPNTTAKRKAEIKNEMSANETTWTQIKCQAVWGDILREATPEPVHPIVDPGMIDGVEVIDEPGGAETPEVSQPDDDQDQNTKKGKKDKKGKKGKRGGKGRGR